MANVAHFFTIYTGWIVIPLFAIVGVIYHFRTRTKGSLIFALGLLCIALGQFIQIFSPFQKMTFDEFSNVLASTGPPVTWYLGSIVFSSGLIVTAIGFVIITFFSHHNVQIPENT